MRFRVAALAIIAYFAVGSRSSGTFDDAVAKLREVALEPVRAPCEMPERAAVVTFVNSYHFPLLLLQRRAMELRGKRDCLERRTVTVCLDEGCAARCAERAVRGCVASGSRVGASDFAAGDYRLVTYMKHELIRDVLADGAVSELFFFDSDVLVFDDPWAAARLGRYDVLYQVEAVAKYAILERLLGTCTRPVNSGQMLVRSGGAALRAFDLMVSWKQNITSGTKLDQDYLLDAMQLAGARPCHLSPARFVGACRHHRAAGARARELVTYHGTCYGTEADKASVLERVVSRMENLKDGSYDTVDDL